MKDFGTLILRLGFGGLIMPHGIQKLMNFAEFKMKFMPFMGMSPAVSLSLVIFAELFCGALIVLGLLTRFAAIPLIITMAVALIMAHHWDVTATGQAATLFLTAFLCLLCTGGGKYSLDRSLLKWG